MYIGYKLVQRKEECYHRYKVVKSTDFAILKIEVLGEVVEPWNSNKKRTNKIKVLSAESLNRKPLKKQQIFYPINGNTIFWREKGEITYYCVGETVFSDFLNDCQNLECGEGINFFTSKYQCIKFAKEIFVNKSLVLIKN